MTEPARSFQHYEVLRRTDGTPWELGRGAMGITYKAFDVNLCCEVALKVVNSALVEHPEARERFVREARSAAALRHRNVASVYHLGNDGEHFFYAMEFINGETLDALVRRGGPLSVENTLRVILQVARALAAAERQHLVHRDIKPANLMVTHEDADEETVVKVIDFGLARAAATDPNAAPLTLGGFVGTPQYASPEQLEERPLDARSDFYSLGVTAWFLLTGRTPFAGSLATICQQQLTQPPPWEQLSHEVPTCVRGLLGHLLAKDAARRPQNAAELRADIEACLRKVQGTERKRDLQLATLPQSAEAPRETRGKATARTVQTGTLLNTRYRLLREIGGRDGVRVYQARDESEGEKPLAIKILPDALAPTSAARNQLSEEIRLVQAAAHPHLVKIRALERSVSPPAMFLVEEWLTGCTLRDLLAGRGGALLVAEALCLLEQAAEASDHAANCRLDPLDLALTDLHLCFPTLAASSEEGLQVRALLPKSTAEWPVWTLKIPAFRPYHDPLALDTWAGGVTLLPSVAQAKERAGDAGASLAARRVQALARLVYELLGGTPTVHRARTDETPTRYASLPVLNEGGNALLRQALEGESAIVSGRQWHEAFTNAIGGGPARGDASFSAARPGTSLLPETAATLETAQDPSEVPGSTHESPLTSYSFVETSGPRPTLVGGESVAPFFQDKAHLEGRDTDEALSGSAWDRLSLVNSERTHPGHWLAGIIGLAAVFMLVFVGVLAWLLEQTPAHVVATPPAKQRRAQVAVPATDHGASRRATPSPLAAHPVASPPPETVSPPHENFLAPATAAAAPVETTPEPTPITVAQVADTTPPPPEIPLTGPGAAPPREKLATVRLDSVPQGAQIRVGNEFLGTTPCRVRLPPGEHQLIARYQDWPETRQTIRLDDTQARTSVEIRLMRPDLVPGLSAQPTVAPDSRLRRIFAPSAHRTPYAEPPAPSMHAAPTPFTSPAPNANSSEPETRPAQRVLTPFRIDRPAEAPSPEQSPARNLQPFSANDGGRD